jgi:hypothetical protein
VLGWWYNNHGGRLGLMMLANDIVLFSMMGGLDFFLEGGLARLDGPSFVIVVAIYMS